MMQRHRVGNHWVIAATICNIMQTMYAALHASKRTLAGTQTPPLASDADGADAAPVVLAVCCRYYPKLLVYHKDKRPT
jgi:hypothetical protein